MHQRHRSFIERGQSSAETMQDIGSLQLPKQTRRQVREVESYDGIFSSMWNMLVNIGFQGIPLFSIKTKVCNTVMKYGYEDKCNNSTYKDKSPLSLVNVVQQNMLIQTLSNRN